MNQSETAKSWQLALMIAVLFGVGALRLRNLVDFVEWHDEIWSVWHVQGGLGDVLARTPADWPPLFGVVTWGWTRVVGSRLEVARYLSVLFSTLTLALIYQLVLALYELLGNAAHTANRRYIALLAVIIYASLGYVAFASVDFRAYSMLLMFGALAAWLTLLWLRRQTKGRSVALMIALAILIYTSYTSLALVAFLTVFVLANRPRLFTRWALIGAGVLALVAPLAPRFFNNGPGRITDVMPQPLPLLGEALFNIYRDFGGSFWAAFVLVVAAAWGLTVVIRYPAERRAGLLLFGWVLFPLVIYFGANNNEFMKPRYMWWVAPGLAVFVGFTSRYLHRVAFLGLLAFFVFLPALPVDFFAYQLAETASPPFRKTFDWLADNMRPDDVLVIDPLCTCGDPFAWDFFVPQYFPTGYLPIVDRPGDAPRVWYLSTQGWPQDEGLLAEVQSGRKASIFFGPWYFLLRLYEGPPSAEGVSFGDQLRLHGAEIENNRTVLRESESFDVRLWWSADAALAVDYSISLAVWDRAGGLVAQADGPPRAPDTPDQTSAWRVGEYFVDNRTIQLPQELQPGPYRLVVTVYQWWDGVRLAPTENALWELAGPDGTYLKVRDLTVVSY